eukprot:6213542-Pleurochrysis_carterae.AAC.2
MCCLASRRRLVLRVAARLFRRVRPAAVAGAPELLGALPDGPRADQRVRSDARGVGRRPRSLLRAALRPARRAAAVEAGQAAQRQVRALPARHVCRQRARLHRRRHYESGARRSKWRQLLGEPADGGHRPRLLRLALDREHLCHRGCRQAAANRHQGRQGQVVHFVGRDLPGGHARGWLRRRPCLIRMVGLGIRLSAAC